MYEPGRHNFEEIERAKGRQVMRVSEVAPAPLPAVTLDEAKRQLNIDPADLTDDPLLTQNIAAASKWAESYTGRAFVTRNCIGYLKAFPRVVEMPKPPLGDVTAIKYKDGNGVEQTVVADVYEVVNPDPKYNGEIHLLPGKTWPVVQSSAIPISIEFAAGWPDQAAVPEDIKQGILYIVAHYFETRTPIIIGTIAANVPLSAYSLLNMWRVTFL